MNCKVVEKCKIVYGKDIKAYIYLERGQLWELKCLPSKQSEWYFLIRDNVAINVDPETFKNVFELMAGEIE